MTNVFKYDFGPTRTPPIGLPVLNLPGSFGDLVYQSSAMIDWGLNNWMDMLFWGFAAYGALTLLPRMWRTGSAFVKKFVRV